MELEGGIRQDVTQAEAGQRGDERENGDSGWKTGSTQGEAPDHYFICSPDEAARTNVGQIGGHSWVPVVDFHQANAGRLADAADDRGVSAGRERREDNRFPVIARLKDGAFDLRSLRTVFPVVVALNQGAARPAQFEHRIVQNIRGRDTGVRQGRSQTTDDDRLGHAPADDEPTDQYSIANLDA